MAEIRVWWIPQVPMKAFYATVKTISEGKRLLDTLANYDAFQLENNIKPEYSNAGGLQIKNAEGEWEEYEVEP